MRYDILNRYTGAVQFTAEINCADDAPKSLKIGLAVCWGVMANADLREADLRGADLRGADLREADLRGANLRGANMNGANLREADLRGANLREADLRWADLRWADLREADLRGANLREADLRGANMNGADMRWAGLRGAPVIPEIHAKVYAAATARPELFDMNTFAEGSGHTCGTAQCRAGWVLHVAGQEGLDLEAKIGAPAAAMAIYMASDPERWKTERLPDFYCGNDAALADMKRMAGVA